MNQSKLGVIKDFFKSKKLWGWVIIFLCYAGLFWGLPALWSNGHYLLNVLFYHIVMIFVFVISIGVEVGIKLIKGDKKDDKEHEGS